MRLTVRICAQEEAEAIQRNSSDAQLPIFKELWWWNAASRAAAIDYELLAVTDGNADVALMPLFRQSLPLVRRVGAPLRGTFTSSIGLRPLVAHRGDRAACLQAVVQHAQAKLRANWMEFGYAAEEEPIALAAHEAAKWRREEKITFVIDLAADVQDAWTALDGRARNMVRKAEKHGVRIVHLDGSAEDIAQFYDTLKATFAKSGRTPPHSKSFYETLVRELVDRRRMLFLGAEFGGEKVAFGMFPFNGYEIQYLSGAASPAGNSSAANSLIQWEVIRFAVERGIKRYDLGGAGIASIDKFKMSFGGRRETYTRYTWMTPWLRGALDAYLEIRPMLDRLKLGLQGRR